MKVFRMNDCDWWAGEDLDSTKKAYFDEVGGFPDYDARECSALEMESLLVFDEAGNNPINFMACLKEMESAEERFPCFFASTEY